MIENLIDKFLNDLGVNEEQIETQIIKGLKIPHHRKIFEQLLIVDNFIVFKKLMVKRNKELELEAFNELEQLENEETIGTGEVSRFEKLNLEKDQAEIEYAIAMSLSIEIERQKLMNEEDNLLQEALRLSEKEYESQQIQIKQDQEAEALKIAKAKEALHKQEPKKEEPKKEEPKKEEPKKEEPKKEVSKKEELKKEEPKIEESKSDFIASKIKFERKEEEIKDIFNSGKKLKLEPLKPLKSLLESDEISQMLSNNSELKEKAPPKFENNYEELKLEELLNKKASISKKIEDLNSEVSIQPKTENLEERKERLQAQRNMILAKKKAEREAELKKYEDDQVI